MIRVFAAVLSVIPISFFFLLTGQSGVYAQERMHIVERKIDSLRVIKAGLHEHLRSVSQELGYLETELNQFHFKNDNDVEAIVITNMDASLRHKPAPGASIIRTIPQNTMLEAIAYQGAYWKVRYEEAEGWVMRLFVNEGEGAERVKEKVIYQEDELVDSLMASQKWKRERRGKSFLITDLGHHINSAGGISIYYAFEHLDSTRALREITLSVTPFNAQGDVEKGENSGATTRRLRRFGQVTVADGSQRFQFDNVWYNELIRCVQIDRIDLTYANGTRQSLRKEKIRAVLAGDLDNNCRTTSEERYDSAKSMNP